jgi:hypothetical protein
LFYELSVANDIQAAQAVVLKVESFFDSLIDSSTMLSKEQSIYYMIFDLSLFKKYFKILNDLNFYTKNYDIKSLNQLFSSSMSVLAYPDGNLPAFGDTSLGLNYNIKDLSESQYLEKCLNLENLGYYKIFNQYIQIIMLSHCAESPHGHYSPLHIDVWAKTHGLILTDSGGPYYYGHTLRYEYFCSPIGHNTISFDSEKIIKLNKISININKIRNKLNSILICSHGSLERNIILSDEYIYITDIVQADKNWNITWHFSDYIKLIEFNHGLEIYSELNNSIIGKMKFFCSPPVGYDIVSGYLTYGHNRSLVESKILKFYSCPGNTTIKLEIELIK